MSNKNKGYKNNGKQKAKLKLPLYLIVTGAACVVTVIATIIVSIVMAQRPPRIEFIPPEFESDAVVGMPDAPEDAGYSRIYQEGMTFSAYLCGGVTQENGEAVVYFTSSEDNTAWIKLRICDENGSILGESGLLKPGEYVRSVALSEPVAAGATLKMKLMAYEPDTYFSVGSVTLNTVMG